MTERSAFREPMVWLMLGLPAASVVAGILLVITAVRSGGADTVGDEVRRTAQIQVTELGADATARNMSLSAVLRLEANFIEVLPATGEFPRSLPLQLILRHPTDAKQDRSLTLMPTSQGWRSADKVRTDHAWLAQLAPADRAWRVRGRVPAGQRASYLAPALVPD